MEILFYISSILSFKYKKNVSKTESADRKFVTKSFDTHAG